MPSSSNAAAAVAAVAVRPSQPHALRTSANSPKPARKARSGSTPSTPRASATRTTRSTPTHPRAKTASAKKATKSQINDNDNDSRSSSSSGADENNEQFLWQDCLIDALQVVGPLPHPSGAGDVAARMDEHKSHPAIVASTFLQCMMIRQKSRLLGQKMLAKTLHSACKTGGGVVAVNEHSIRTFTIKQIQVLAQDPNAIKSLVNGTSADSNYEAPALQQHSEEEEEEEAAPRQHQFAVERVTAGTSPSSSGAGISFANREPNAAPTCDVHFVCSGALPTHSKTRFVRLELEKGGAGWRVRSFSDLVKPVLAPTVPAEEVSQEEEEAAAAAAAATKAEDDYIAPSAFSSRGLSTPVFGSLTKWKSKAKRETAAQRMLRHEVAKTDTKGLARKLSAAELNRKFAANPVDRVVVSTGTGVITKRYVKKGEMFDEAVGFEVKMHTVEDHQRELAEAKAAAEKAAAQRREERLRAAMGLATSG